MPEKRLLVPQGADATAELVKRLGENTATFIQSIRYDTEVRVETWWAVKLCPASKYEYLTTEFRRRRVKSRRRGPACRCCAGRCPRGWA
jgi:hypothetical protein